MSPAAIIREAAADGVSLELSSAGTIKAAGNQAAVNRWLPVLREHKPTILAELAAPALTCNTEDSRFKIGIMAGVYAAYDKVARIGP